MSTTSPVAPGPQLHIHTSRSSRTWARVAVVGEVDLTTAPLLRDSLFSVLHDEPPAVIDVDLAGVSFLDCAAIGALVAARNLAVHTGQQIQVSHPRPIVRRLLDLSGLLGVLTAPIDQPGQRPPEPDHPAGAGSDTAISNQPPDLMAVA